MSTQRSSTSTGLGLGSAFAAILSWTTWHSFWWTILHAILSWVYVGYFFLWANHDARFNPPCTEPAVMECAP